MAGNSIVALSEQNFNQTVAAASGPVIVDFWAPWCGPCRMIAPAVEELAAEYDGKLLFAKVNVDENPGLAARFGVMSIPTLLVLKAGKEATRLVGYMAKSDIKNKIEAAL